MDHIAIIIYDGTWWNVADFPSLSGMSLIKAGSQGQHS